MHGEGKATRRPAKAQQCLAARRGVSLRHGMGERRADKQRQGTAVVGTAERNMAAGR